MSLTSDEVNILVYRYLEESGFAHTAFSFVAESQITKSPAARVNLPPGALLAFLQKGLQYTEIEAHLKDDGTAVPFDSEFSLLTPYLPRGGLAPAKPPPSATKRKLTGAAARHRKGRRAGDPADVGDGSFDPSVSETAVLPLTGHAGPVYHCLWNPLHPGLIASGSEDATVRVWNIAALGPHARMSRHLAGQVSAAAISLDHRPSNAAAAAAAAAGGAGPTASVTVVDWSPDGSRLATGCTDGPVRIWTLQEDGVSMAFSKGLARKAGPILALRWSPDGALVAAGSDADGGVTVWDAATGEVVQSYATHKRMVSDLSWMSIPAAAESMPNGKGEGHGGAGAEPAAGGAAARHGDRYRLATCSAERIIYVFGTESPEPLRALAGHSAEVNSLQWSPCGSRLLSASDDQTARVWNLGGLRGAPRAAAAGAEAGSGGAAAARADNDTVVVLEGHRKEVYSARWSPRKQQPRRAVSAAAASSSSAAADNDSNAAAAGPPDFLVATASFDHAVKLWNAATGECLRTLTRHSSCVYSVAFSPSGRYLASGSYDSEVLVWDVATGAVVLSYVHGSASATGSPGIFDVRWSSEGNKIAASFVDRTICVLNFDGRSPATDAAAAGAGGGGAPAAAKTKDDQQVVKRSRN